MKSKTNKINLFLPSLILIIGAIFSLMYFFVADTVIEKLFILFIAVSVFITLLPTILTFLINLGVKSCINGNIKENTKTNNNKSLNTSSEPKTIEKHKKKVCTTKGYEEFINLIKSSIQNKLMDRECVLKLKGEIFHRLGTHAEIYRTFTFKNDLHCIYTISKSSKLTTDDYLYLSNFLSDNLILPK
ncbi:hypothetical protein FDF26_13830 [Clostridium botulinum]|nr:hypothetical protein [Clostridium botulinum]